MRLRMPQARLHLTRRLLLVQDGREAMNGERIAEVLGEVWDDGNCTGLDGWVGPGRGSIEIDEVALHDRKRAIAKYAAMLAPLFATAQAEARAEALAEVAEVALEGLRESCPDETSAISFMSGYAEAARDHANLKGDRS